MYYPNGSKVKFSLKFAPYSKGLGTIINMFEGDGVPCVYQVEIEEIDTYYQAGDNIFVFPKEIDREVYFE